MLAWRDGDDDVIALTCPPGVDLLVTAAEFCDLVDDHPGDGFSAPGCEIGRDNLEGVFGGVDGFDSGAVVSGVVDAENAAADAVGLGADAVGAVACFRDAEDDFVVHAGEGFALFAHDFGGSEIKGIHFQLVVFREWDGVIEFTGFDVTLTEVHFRPFDFEQASAVFLHMCFAVEGEFHGFAPAVGMRGDEGADEFGVLLDQGVPLGFLADTEHFGDVRCHFHSDAIFRRESGNGGCLGNGKGMPVEWRESLGTREIGGIYCSAFSFMVKGLL